jgi:protein O-mannosyl-transferase
LLAALVYANAMSGPFLFDDENAIVRNSQIRQLWPPAVPLSPPRDTSVAGRPLVNLSLAANYAVHQLDVRGYHVFNLTIHALAALVLFGIVRRTLELPHITGTVREQAVNLAWGAAALWLLHPLQTEPVNYIVERTELMMGLAYLVTLYAGIRALQEQGRRRWRVVAIGACAAGMACKESMVTAPLAVMLYDSIYSPLSLRETWRTRKALYGGLAATWLVLAALMASDPRSSVGFNAGTTPWLYFLNQLEMIATYLRLSVWPRELVLDYGPPKQLAYRDVLPQAAVVLGLAIATVAALYRRPRIGFLAAWFFLTLAPTTSFVPIATEVGAERRMYLPLAALCVLAVLGGFRLFRERRAWGAVAALAVTLFLAAGTVARNAEYRSRLSMAETIRDRRPSGKSHYVVAIELLRVGRRDDGLAELRSAVSDYPEARYALGTELLGEQKFDAAIYELCSFVRARPTHPNVILARDQLGRAFLSQGDLAAALRQFNLVLIDPGYRLRSEVLGMVQDIDVRLAGNERPDRVGSHGCNA